MKQTFESIFMMRSPGYGFLLPRMRAALGVDEVRFEDITSVNMLKFREYMMGEVANNSLKTYFAVIKSVINTCYSDGLIMSNKCISELHVKAEPQQNVALTDKEIKLLEEYYDKIDEFSHKTEKDILTLFLMEVYSGARGIDCEAMTLDNIADGKLSYVSRKTRILAVLPAHKRMEYLIKHKPVKQYSRMTKNRVIKKIAKQCGITYPVSIFYHGKQCTKPKYEYIGFHVARRSFVSNLIDLGVPITSVNKLAGHSDISMTQRYYVTQDVQLDANAMTFFG